MNKKVVILSTSPRKNSNSEALAEAFAKGAHEAGEIKGSPALDKACEMGRAI